jgi:hypothetical protein
MHQIIWTRNFLLAQGYDARDNVVFQDNQSAILLERNGRRSSGRRTRHINIRYFFVTDRIKNGELRVEYCPTGDMVADFFTKPLQGAQFKKLRAIIMNMSEDLPLPLTSAGPQECVGANSSGPVGDSTGRSWADVVRSPAIKSGPALTALKKNDARKIELVNR